MRADELAAYAQVAAVLVSAVAILIALKGIRDQLWLITFSEYTRRYSEIMRDIPSEARRPGGNFSLSELSPPDRDKVLNAMRAYLNLCSEEFYLHKKGKIDKKTWDIWTQGIREVLRLPCFSQTIPVLRSEYTYFDDFCAVLDVDCGLAERSAPLQVRESPEVS